MCDMASFIITQNSVLWHPKSDSHSDILEKYEIKDDYYKPDFVKVGIVPPDHNYSLPIEKWEYSVDSYQKYIPEWYNSEEAEKACRIELKNWYKEKVIKKGKHTFSGKVNKIILGCNVVVNDLDCGSRIQVCGKSKVIISNMNGGMVWFYDNSTGILNNQSGGYVYFYDNSIITINKQSEGNVYFCENSTGEVNNQSGGIIYFNGNSTGTLNNQSDGYVNFCNNSTGTLNNKIGGEVYFYNNSKQINERKKNEEFS